MNGRFRHFLAAVLAVTLSPFVTATGQDTGEGDSKRLVEIVNADALYRVRNPDGSTDDILEGKVDIVQGDTRLKADRAATRDDGDHYEFSGNVRITHQDDTLLAPLVTYSAQNRIARAIGGTRWSDADVIVDADTSIYHLRDRWVQFLGRVQLRDSTTTVQSATGSYDVDERTGRFAGDVRLLTDDSAISADSVEHFRVRNRTVATGEVVMRRTVKSDSGTVALREYLFAEYAESEDSTRISIARGEPVLLRLEGAAAGPDTLVVAAAELVATETDSTRVLLASDSARLWKSNLAVVSDTIHYARTTASQAEGVVDSVASPGEEATVTMTGKPVLWVENSQISGRIIRLYMTEDEVDSLVVVGDAFLVYLDSTDGEMQQLKGKSLHGLFSADSLRTLTLTTNAEARFVTSDDSQAEKIGTIRFSGDEIALDFRMGKLDRIRAGNDVEGEYTSDDGGQGADLPGYFWIPEKRPDLGTLLPSRLIESLEGMDSSSGASGATVDREAGGSD